MATMQVPGFVPANQDTLHGRCWAEQGDRLLTVEGLDGQTVRYAERDRGGNLLAAPAEMPVLDFQRSFSDSGWTWHDKTPVPVAA